MSEALKLAQRLQLIGPWVWSDCTREQAVTELATAYIDLHERMERVAVAVACATHAPTCASVGCHICCGLTDPEYCGIVYGEPCDAGICDCALSRILALTKGTR